MRIFARLSLLLLALCAVPGVALAHEEFLDHPAPPPGVAGSAPQTTVSEDPRGKWKFIASIATGNPHSDLDFFDRGGDTFASVGTLGAGPNGGGQTIIQLTQSGRIAPRYVGRQPSASCVVNEAAALGLQHDVESSPKGDTILNSFNPFASREDTKVIIDATDASGRCHDSQFFGGASALATFAPMTASSSWAATISETGGSPSPAGAGGSSSGGGDSSRAQAASSARYPIWA